MEEQGAVDLIMLEVVVFLMAVCTRSLLVHVSGYLLLFFLAFPLLSFCQPLGCLPKYPLAAYICQKCCPWPGHIGKATHEYKVNPRSCNIHKSESQLGQGKMPCCRGRPSLLQPLYLLMKVSRNSPIQRTLKRLSAPIFSFHFTSSSSSR